MCSSGDSTAKQAEVQQANFQNQLMGVFQQQYGKQSAITDYLTGVLKPMIQNPTGYSPEALAALRTGATDTIATQYANAGKALRNNQFINGGESLPSGVNDMQTGMLAGAQAADTASAQNEITLENENLKQQNYWNAINGINGVAAMTNPLGYAGEATNAGNSVAGLSTAFKNSQSSQLLGALGGIAGGVGSALSGRLIGCWVAAAVFGEDFFGPRASLVRGWLYFVWIKHWYAKPVLWLYSRIGKQIAKRPFIVRALAPLFHAALRKAQEC